MTPHRPPWRLATPRIAARLGAVAVAVVLVVGAAALASRLMRQVPVTTPAASPVASPKPGAHRAAAMSSPTPLPSAANACTAADLGARFTPWSALPKLAGGGHGALVTVWNRGARTCFVSGTPEVSFVDAAGHTFAPAVTPDGTPGSPVTLLPGFGEPRLGAGPLPGGSATASVLWQPACGTRISGPTVTAMVQLPGGALPIGLPLAAVICVAPGTPDAIPAVLVSSWGADWSGP